MWIEDPIAQFGAGEVEPTTLDPLEAVTHPVVLASDPKHFYAFESLVHLLESGKARNPVTRALFTLDDVRPLVTARTTAHEYAELVQQLVAFGWSPAHIAEDAPHMTAPTSIGRFHRVWSFVERVMVDHWPRLPLVSVHEMYARWKRYTQFYPQMRRSRAPELLVEARRCDYARNSSAALHRLADRFVGLMQLFCGRHTDVTVRRRTLIHGFTFLAWRRGLPVRFETAYRFLDLRLESDRADMQNFLLRPSTPHDALRRALERELLHRPMDARTPPRMDSLHLEEAVARALAPAHRRYSSTELLDAFASLIHTMPTTTTTTTAKPNSAKRQRLLAPQAPHNLYVMLVRHVEPELGGRCPSIEAALCALPNAPTLSTRRA